MVKQFLKTIYLNLRKILLGTAARFFLKESPDFTITHEIKKILFIRIDRIGDLVLSTPLLRVLKKRFNASELTVLASVANQALVINNPHVDKIIVYDSRQKLMDKIRLLGRLREYGFDLVIDPYVDYELKTALIALSSDGNKRIGYQLYGREICFNMAAVMPHENKHFVDLTLDVLEPLGIASRDRNPEIFLTEGEKGWAKNWVKEKDIGFKPLIGIHPGAHYESQRWPVERFSELVEQLQNDKGLDLIIFGGPGDEKVVGSIGSMIHSDALAYITNDLRRFSALLSCCSILICNNSGPLHMAVALNIPTISMMGPTNKNRWMPIGDIHKVLRIDELPCIGCNLGYCKIGSHDCMKLIDTWMVMNVVRDFLKNKTS